MTVTLPAPAVDYGHVEVATIHFDEMDAMGVLHNGRYALLMERAMVAFWTKHGRAFGGADTFNVVKEFQITYHVPIRGTGEVLVHFWIDRLGNSSAVYAFRIVSTDQGTVFAEGRRVVIKLDPATLTPTPWSPDGRVIAETLLVPSTKA